MTAGHEIDTSDEAIALVCMIVSNPKGAMRKEGDGWQRRVNDLIRALRDERNELRAKLSEGREGSTSADVIDGLANLRAILDDQPTQNSVLTASEIATILDNKGGFMPDEAVVWFREWRAERDRSA